MESSRNRALSFLLAAQNSDGGWGYRSGGSWTEPSAYALLALAAETSAADSVGRGVRWLAGLQRPEGGWPPRLTVGQSTWVTALAVLTLAARLELGALERATRWLLGQSGKESGFFRRLRLKLLGVEAGTEAGFEGWPWFPDTAAWVAPTALTILALEKVRRRAASPGLDKRLESGRRFLWSRMCRDGGWNHGSSRALGYEAGSYPETTGLALLALHGANGPQLPRALAAAERHLRSCRSAEGISWLRLGLLAHPKPATDTPVQEAQCRNVMENALFLLSERAAAGSNPFLE
jgi:hypothetical protein